MSILAIRNSIRNWLGASTRIDEWDLDTPSNRAKLLVDEDDQIIAQYPANCAFYDAIADLSYQRQDSQIVVTATFRYYINYRFDFDLSFYQIPIAELENLQQYLLTSLISNKNLLGQFIKDISVTGEEYPLLTRRIEGEDQDWLVTMILPFTIIFNSLAVDEFPNINPPKDVLPDWQLRSLSFKIYKDEIGANRSDLDRVITKDYEEVE
ncbi:MAG: hypothetical protein HC878_00325 [Leptolyngbyaceae cyanobacterium SL_5_14]|nr:hypothetical protein [Leptolyngbyaceae cyanobacterium SL_5_14]